MSWSRKETRWIPLEKECSWNRSSCRCPAVPKNLLGCLRGSQLMQKQSQSGTVSTAKKNRGWSQWNEIGNLEHKLGTCFEGYMGQKVEESWFCWCCYQRIGFLRMGPPPSETISKNSTLITFTFYNINFKLLYFLLLNLLLKDSVYLHCFGTIFILLRVSSPPTSSGQLL